MKLVSISLVGIIYIIQLFLFINAESIYGEQAPLMKNILLSYFILFLITAVIFPGGVDDIPLPSLFNFAVGFVLTAVVLLPLSSIVAKAQIASVPTVLAIGYGLFHSLVVAFNETTIFQKRIPRGLSKGRPNLLADILSNIFFAFFHVTAIIALLSIKGIPVTFTILSGSFILLFILGMVWAKVFRDNLGIMSAVGSHFAYNLAVLGVLTKLV